MKISKNQNSTFNLFTAKQFFLFIVMALFIFACGKEDTTELLPQDTIIATDGQAGNRTQCVSGELTVMVPIQVENADDEGGYYTLYVHPVDNATGTPFSPNPKYMWAHDYYDGVSNTQIIVDELENWNGGNYAAKICADLAAQTGCDWYLPSMFELENMYKHLGEYGSNDMPDGKYWSSTERAPNASWFKNFNTGHTGLIGKHHNLRCRCVRQD